jgi:hemerythrin
MGLFAWPGRHTVGCPEMDGDHLTMLQMLDRLHEAMIQGRGSAVVGRTLEALADHEAAHFEREEHLLEVCGYPGLEEHRGRHRTMLDELDVLRRRARAGHLPIACDTMQTMRRWIRHHIDGDDRAAALYVMGQPRLSGVAPAIR